MDYQQNLEVLYAHQKVKLPQAPCAAGWLFSHYLIFTIPKQNLNEKAMPDPNEPTIKGGGE